MPPGMQLGAEKDKAHKTQTPAVALLPDMREQYIFSIK